MTFKLLGAEECKHCSRDWRNKEVPLRESNPFDAPSPRCICGCFIKTYPVKHCGLCDDEKRVKVFAGSGNSSLEEIACPECVEEV